MTNQLSHANLFFDLSNLTLRRMFKTDQGWIMEAHSQNSAVCPGCQSISRLRHSRYWRSLKDLPVQMDPARRAAGKKPDAAAPGNARIVPRLFTSALGGLSAWAHAIGGDSEARLRRLLLGPGKIPFAVASAKSRDPKGDLRRSTTHRNLGQQSRWDQDNCRRRLRRHC
jgi:hypothetical protein